MLTKQLIAALTEAVRASTPVDTLRALAEAREALGESAEACEPLFYELARRCDEIQRLRDLAGRDPLTGAANRRTFEEELTREAARHRRTSHPFAIILFDLDDLKSRNDRLGHAAGDEALMALSRACLRTVRETDLVARLGGDEFAVLLPGSTYAGATVLATRLREAIEQTEIEGGPLRVSLGIAAADHAHGPVEHIVQMADRDLYQDKALRKARSRASGDFAAA
ncbi:MAG TPA: GGDEF domain-containing protein [Polyangiales bacterium]|jgi:diguanylate cyclase (GGDEF)-like protein|nr:GGDEF domain-containing protein [Polyangiales bacterium]